MSSLTTLMRELHRRSVWQVVGIYLATSWGVLNAVDVLTGFAGLPDWTPTMAVVLLLIGFPIVTATAVIQKGLPGGGESASGPDSEVAPNRISAAVDGVGGRPPTAAEHETRASGRTLRALFTWRNALTVALRRLGPLHEQAGDTAGAIAAYSAFAEAWADADPELQPQVALARQRITALGGS